MPTPSKILARTHKKAYKRGIRVVHAKKRFGVVQRKRMEL